MNQRTTPESPWYRQVAFWLLMIPPGAAVLGGALTAWLAGGPPALVVDDYGAIAMATEQRQARDSRARELGLTAELQLEGGAGGGMRELRLRLSAAPDFQPPDRLRLQLVHPTREEQDRELWLEGSRGVYSGRIGALPGRMYLQLQDPESAWRLVGELGTGVSATRLSPAPGAPPAA